MVTLTPNYDFNLPAVADPIDADLWGGQLNANWSKVDTLLLGAGLEPTTGALETPDNTFRVIGSVDATKKAALEVDGLTTATTRTLTVQDVSGTIYVTAGQDVSIADGGTGASTKADAFDALSPTTTTGDIIYYNGTDNTRLAVGATTQVLGVSSGSPAWVNSAAWAYESAEQAITANTTITVAHSLGYLPRDVQVVIRNKTTEYSWAVGDEIPMMASGVQNNTGFGYGMNTTNIYVTIPTAVWVYYLDNPANFNAITLANWRIVIRAR